MNDKQKGQIIGNIIAQMRMLAESKNKQFDAGDMFFSLAFKEDKELLKIARMCGA